MGVLSFPAHGPKRAYVALCALYPVCAELFLPYESSADRRPAKPKPLACYVESLRGVEQQVEVRSAAYAKRGDGQSRRARGPQAAQQQQRSAQKIVRHSPRCPTYSRISTERREDIHIKRRDVEVRGAVKPARAIARGQASPAGLSRCADLENELQHHQR